MSPSRTLAKELFIESKSKSLYVLIVSVLSSLLNSVGLVLLVPILFKSFNINVASEISSGIEKTFDKYFYWLPGSHSAWLLLTVLLLFISKNLLIAARVHLVSDLTKTQYTRLRARLLSHILNKDLHYFLKVGNGTILNLLNANVDRAARLMVDAIEFLGMAFQLCAYIGVMMYISWKLCVICFVFVGPLLLINRIISNRARDMGSDLSRSNSELAQKLNDLLNGIRYVKLSAREKDHTKWIADKTDSIMGRFAKLSFLSSIGQPIVELSALVVLIAMVTFLSFVDRQSIVGADAFFSYLLILSRAMPLVNQVSNLRVEIASGAGFMTEIATVLQDSSYESKFG